MTGLPVVSCGIAAESPTAGPPETDREMGPRLIESRRFGPLEVWPDKVITFPMGLIGFEEFRQYVLVAPEGLEPLSFLVALDDPDVAFPVLPGELCLPGYAPTIPSDTLEIIGGGPGGHVEILAICAIAPDTGTLHANLRGPVVVNPATRTACQAVLHDGNYSLRHLLGAG